MLRFAIMGTGAVVLALVLSGGVKTVTGWFNGTDSPANVQRNITEEFSEAGFVVPAQGNSGTVLGGSGQQRDPYAGGSSVSGRDPVREQQDAIRDQMVVPQR